jgi:hypothetical protein
MESRFAFLLIALCIELTYSTQHESLAQLTIYLGLACRFVAAAAAAMVAVLSSHDVIAMRQPLQVPCERKVFIWVWVASV